jgi:hypothetical protein
MPVPRAVRTVNKHVTKPLLRALAGHGWFVELEHVGRRSGTRFRTTLMAFRHGSTVTIALTYGPDVDWTETSARPVAAGCTSADSCSPSGRRRH